jgi:CheY-like chemotaxis protein
MNTTEHKQNATVMLVDNSSIDNFVNTKIITRYQFADNVIPFNKASKALKYLLELNSKASSTEIPSVLFLDLDMPEINGFEFLNAFHLLSDKIKKNIKIVILTNSADPSDAIACSKNKSVVAFFQKPLIKDNIMVLNQLLKVDGVLS